MKKVTHNQFGTGTILDMDEKKVRIDFNGTIKNLIIQFANLTLEDGSKLESKSVMTGDASFVMPKRKVKKVNPANFMTDAEFAKTDFGKMTEDEREEYLRLEAINNLPSSMRN